MKYKCTFVISEANRILNPGCKTTRRDVRRGLRARASQTTACASLVGALGLSDISTSVTSLRLRMRLIAVVTVVSGKIRSQIVLANVRSRLCTLADGSVRMVDDEVTPDRPLSRSRSPWILPVV